MDLSRQYNMVGLCNQCEQENFPRRFREFAGLPHTRRNVFCYICGATIVDGDGNCLVHTHNRSRLDRLVRWIKLTLKRFSRLVGMVNGD